jgi:hypothetical protein
MLGAYSCFVLPEDGTVMPKHVEVNVCHISYAHLVDTLNEDIQHFFV